MATKYTINFADTTKTPFEIQAFTNNGPVSASDQTAMPGAITATTTLKLYGKSISDYGEGLAQDLLYLLENFANITEPVSSIEGQLWYNNSTLAELFIKNTTNWDAVILATGTSAMTGELTLAGNPTDPLHAVNVAFLDIHNADQNLHLTPIQNTFLDGLMLSGSPPTLTAVDVNQLIGINTTLTVQDQFDDIQTQFGVIQLDINSKLSLSGGTMLPSANITLNLGEIFGVPFVPTQQHSAASKQYVDDTISSGVGGDGVLTSATWINPTPQGSPIVPVDTTQTTLELIITLPDLTEISYEVEDIARNGHIHLASTIVVDNSFNVNYPADVQGSIEYIETNKADLLNPIFTSNIQILGTLLGNAATFTSTVTGITPVNSNDLVTKQYVDDLQGGGTTPPPPDPAGVPDRQFSELLSDITSPAPFQIQSHLSGDDAIFITINGIKQYVGTRGIQDIKYDPNVVVIINSAPTGLLATETYDFALAIDGAAPTTISIVPGSTIATHGQLVTTINSLLAGAGLSSFAIDNETTERFYSNAQGATSNVVLSDPGSANTYLFAEDQNPITIVTAEFISDSPFTGPSTGSPVIVVNPDKLTIAGDRTAIFTVGTNFSIRGSDDPTYGSFDGIYSVHIDAAIFDGVNTIIPIGVFDDPNTNRPLLFTYIPQVGSPAPTPPAPSAFGSTYRSPIIGIDSVQSEIPGIGGDYIETDPVGVPVVLGVDTSDVVFNYDILAGSKIESLLFG